MELSRMAALLAPFVPAPLEPAQLTAISAYLDLLLRWNARMNLTSVRDPEHIVTRHFGESLFAAARLLDRNAGIHAIDVGSGAGFPGLPLKIYAPRLRLTLIESQNKKTTFLREVARSLALTEVEIFSGRAETFLNSAPSAPGSLGRERAGLVTLRAVERFESVLPVAASLLQPGPADWKLETGNSKPVLSRLALLIGASQVDRARDLLPQFTWDPAVAIPQSAARVLLVGTPR